MPLWCVCALLCLPWAFLCLRCFLPLPGRWAGCALLALCAPDAGCWCATGTATGSVAMAVWAAARAARLHRQVAVTRCLKFTIRAFRRLHPACAP